MNTTNDQSQTADQVRALVARCSAASLATVQKDGGAPYASLVAVAADHAGRPVLLLSALAWHTQNLLASPAASLLFCSPPGDKPVLESTRASLIGHLAQSTGDEVRQCYLARHGDAALYAGFADFSFWRMHVDTVHVVAGFGRIETIDGADVFGTGQMI